MRRVSSCMAHRLRVGGDSSLGYASSRSPFVGRGTAHARCADGTSTGSRRLQRPFVGASPNTETPDSLGDFRVTATTSNFLGGPNESARTRSTIGLVHSGFKELTDYLHMTTFRCDGERCLALTFRRVGL